MLLRGNSPVVERLTLVRQISSEYKKADVIVARMLHPLGNDCSSWLRDFGGHAPSSASSGWRLFTFALTI